MSLRRWIFPSSYYNRVREDEKRIRESHSVDEARTRFLDVDDPRIKKLESLSSSQKKDLLVRLENSWIAARRENNTDADILKEVIDDFRHGDYRRTSIYNYITEEVLKKLEEH